MIRNISLLLFAAAGVTLAADLAAFKEEMVKIEDAKLDLEEAIDRKDAALVTKAAAKMIPLLVSSERFWIAANLPVAAGKAHENLETAKAVAAAANTGKIGEAGAALKKLSAQCTACHETHYEAKLPK